LALAHQMLKAIEDGKTYSAVEYHANLIKIGQAMHTDAEPETRVLYVGSLFWRDCDPILSVAGFDHNAVSHKLAELAKDELDEAVDADMSGAEDGTDAGDVRDNLETELCSTGVNQFAYPADLETLGIDAEHRAELDADGLTVY
jgi:hypothetical protein